MRVMTLNMWNYESGWETRRAAIVQIIGDYLPDVIALQEARHDFRFERGVGQGEQIAGRTNYTAISAVSQVYVPFPRIDEGLAVLARDAPIRSRVHPFTLHAHRRADENHRICLSITVDRGGTAVHVFDTHFSLDPVARLSNAHELADLVDRVAGAQPAVIMGDLNAEPGSPEIEYLTSDAGFLDIWPAAHGEEPGFTYASFHPVRRIDFILVKNMPAGFVSARLVGTQPLDGIYPSDHLGVVADLPLP